MSGGSSSKKNLVRSGARWAPIGRPGPVTGTAPGLFFGLHQVSKSVTMGVNDEEDDWNSESGEDDGDGPGREDEVEEVI